MYDQAGIWIDRRKALVVTLTPQGAHTTLILSRVEKHPERGGASRLERALTGALNTYYDVVIAAVRGYADVLLFGPGEAKGELHRRLVKMQVGDHVTALEAAEKMTDCEIVAKVREHFDRGAVRAPLSQPAV